VAAALSVVRWHHCPLSLIGLGGLLSVVNVGIKEGMYLPRDCAGAGYFPTYRGNAHLPTYR